MKDSYQFGPIAISKSFVKNPLFWPGVIAVAAVVLLAIGYQTGSLSFSSQQPTPTIKAEVFPLNQRLSKSALYSVGTTIFRSDGQTEERMFEVGSQVLSLVPSNNGVNLAATYTLPSGGSNAAGYPYTSLIFYDMNTKRSLPIIAQERTTVRYPQWSDDGRYLSFWVNEGEESFIYDTSRRRASFSVKREGSTPVSPIVFLPGSEGIAYIKNGTLFSAAVDGTRPISLTDQVTATQTIDGKIVANTPIVSPNGAHLLFYTTGGELAVVNSATRETKVIGEELTSLGFLNNDTILYTQASKDKSDEKKKSAEVFSYSITDAKSTKLANRSSFLSKGALPQAAVLLSSESEWYLPSIYPNLGPQRLTKDGDIEKDCSEAEFHYEYNLSDNDTRFPQSRQVVSPDGKYLLGLSNNALAVLDTETCQPYLITEVKPTAMTWLP